MNERAYASENRDELLRRYDVYREALAQIYHELSDRFSRRRFDLVCRTLQLGGLLGVIAASERLRAAIYEYALFADRHEGRTILEQWVDDVRPGNAAATESAKERLVEALTRSRFSVFDVEGIEPGLGLHIRDVLSGQLTFVVDRLTSVNWTPGQQFGARLLSLPEFAIFVGEPIEAAVKPGDGFQDGALPPADQTKLQAAVIGAFAEATTR